MPEPDVQRPANYLHVREVVASRGRQLRAHLAEPVEGGQGGYNDTAHARLAHVVATLRAVPPIMPRTVPAAAGGFLALGLARKVAGSDLDGQALAVTMRALSALKVALLTAP